LNVIIIIIFDKKKPTFNSLVFDIFFNYQGWSGPDFSKLWTRHCKVLILSCLNLYTIYKFLS
jgi:hypothetical protein